MSSPCDGCAVRAACQPIGREYTTENGAFVKEMDIKHAGTIIPQHAHTYEHISYVAQGAVLFEGKRFDAPHAITVPAFKKHTFQALVPNTLVLCIHAGQPVIAEEHHLVRAA